MRPVAGRDAEPRHPAHAAADRPGDGVDHGVRQGEGAGRQDDQVLL